MALNPLKVRITGDTKDVEDAMTRVSGGLKGVGVAAAAASAAVVGGLAAMTVAGLKAVDQNVKLARSMDATADGLRAVQLAAGYAGVSVEEANTAMQTLNRELARATERGSPAAEALSKLGFELNDLAGLDADERMARIADRVEQLGLNSSQTADLMRDLGIRSRNMTLLMMAGGDAIRSASQEVQDFGLSLSDAQTAGIEAANDSLSRMTLVFEGLRAKLAAEVAPILQRVADQFSQIAKSDAVQSAIDRLAESFGRLADTVLSEDFLTTAANGLAGMASIAASVADGMVMLADNVEIVTVGLSGMAIAVAALGGPLTVVAGLLAAALGGIAAWRGGLDDTKKAADEARRAQETLNNILGPNGFGSASSAAREEAKQNALALLAQAEAAVNAARSELVLQQTMKDRQKAFDNSTLGRLLGTGRGGAGLRNRTQESIDEAGKLLQTRLEALQRLQDQIAQGSMGYGPQPDSGNGSGGGGGFLPSGGGGNDGLKDRLDSLMNGIESEREITQEWYEQGQTDLEDALEQKLITEEEYLTAREELNKEYNKRMRGVENAERQAKLSSMKTVFGGLSSLMMSENDKLFKIGQAAAIANAVVDGYQAAVSAWKHGMAAGGPPLAAAFTAASLARTGAMISSIASQSPRGSSSGGNSSGAAASSGASSPAQQQGVANITFVGAQSQGDMVNVVDQINKLVKQGYRLNANAVAK